MSFTSLVLLVQASVAGVDDSGFAVGLLVFFRLLGGLFGLAIGSTAFSSVSAKSIKALGTLHSSLATLGNSQDAVRLIPQLRDSEGTGVFDQVTDVYSVNSFHFIWIDLIVFVGMGLVASCFTKEVSMEKEKLGRQRFEE